MRRVLKINDYVNSIRTGERGISGDREAGPQPARGLSYHAQPHPRPFGARSPSGTLLAGGGASVASAAFYWGFRVNGRLASGRSAWDAACVGVLLLVWGIPVYGGGRNAAVLDVP